jgi:hypothetical protein
MSPNKAMVGDLVYEDEKGAEEQGDDGKFS